MLEKSFSFVLVSFLGQCGRSGTKMAKKGTAAADRGRGQDIRREWGRQQIMEDCV